MCSFIAWRQLDQNSIMVDRRNFFDQRIRNNIKNVWKYQINQKQIADKIANLFRMKREINCQYLTKFFQYD